MTRAGPARAVLFTSLLAGVAQAGPMAYVSTTTGLRKLDLDTGRAQRISDVGPNGWFQALAFSPNGELFGATAGGGSVYRIDPATGVQTLVGDTGLGSIEGLDFNGNVLVASDFGRPATLYSIATATARPLVTESEGIGVVRTLAILDPATAVVSAERQGGAEDRSILRTIDLRTGESAKLTEITGVGAPADEFGSQLITGMDFAPDGSLYAVAGGGTVVRVDLAEVGFVRIAEIGPFNLGFSIAPQDVVSIPLPPAPPAAMPSPPFVQSAAAAGPITEAESTPRPIAPRSDPTRPFPGRSPPRSFHAAPSGRAASRSLCLSSPPSQGWCWSLPAMTHAAGPSGATFSRFTPRGHSCARGAGRSFMTSTPSGASSVTTTWRAQVDSTSPSSRCRTSGICRASSMK
jgi:hypothetical protein